MSEKLLRYNTESLFVLFDMESFNLNLNFKHNLPWQISLIKAKGDRKLDERDLFIKWKTDLKISDEAARITGYDQRKIDRIGMTSEAAFEQMYEWLNEADYIIGHNILGFDCYLLKEYCILMNKPWKQFVPKFIDTLCLAKAIKTNAPFKPGMNLTEFQFKMLGVRSKGNSLGVLAKEYGIAVDDSSLHSSLYDLGINLQVWNRLKFLLEI